MRTDERWIGAAVVALLVAVPWIFFWRGATMEVLLGDGDTFVQFLPTWTWAAEQWRSLTPPLWTPYLYSGFPLFAEPQAAVFHPLQVLFMVLPPVVALNLTVLAYHGVAAVFTYVLGRQHGLTRAASALGGATFAFSGFLLAHQGITPLLMTAASFPTVFCALGRARRRPDWIACCLLALAVVHLVLTGHPQFTFYALAFGAVYGLYLLVSGPAPERRGYALTAAAAGLLGIGLAAVQLLPTAELTALSVRDELTYEAFAGRPYSPPLLFASLLSTRLASVLPVDGTEGALNVGALPLLLAVFAIALRARAAAFWIGLAVVSSLLWMGDATPLYRLMYHVPGYNLFRIASRNGLMVVFAVSMLAAFGTDALQRRRGGWPRAVHRALLALVPLAVVFGWRPFGARAFKHLWAATGGTRLPLSLETVGQHLAPLAPALAVLALATVAIAVGLWWGGGGRVLAVVAIAVVVSHYWATRDWLFLAPAEEVRRSLAPGAVAAALRPPEGATGRYRAALGGPSSWHHFWKNDRTGWRARYVLAGGVDLNMLHGVPSIGGYSPLMLRDYARLAGAMQMWGGPTDPALFRSAALDLLGVRWVAVPPGKLGFPEETFADLVSMGEEDGMRFYRNPRALPLLWGVETVEGAGEAETWAALSGTAFDPAATALVAPEQAERFDGRRFTVPSRVNAWRPDCNTIAARVVSAGEVFLAAGVLHYPGWTAEVDGERVPLVRANGLFSGLVVPVGEHRVTLAYRPASLRWGLLLTGLASAVLLAGTAVELRRRRRRRIEAPAPAAAD